jgi:hypothetical protein
MVWNFSKDNSSDGGEMNVGDIVIFCCATMILQTLPCII